MNLSNECKIDLTYLTEIQSSGQMVKSRIDFEQNLTRRSEMTLKHILLGSIAGVFATSGAIAADLPAGSTTPAEYVRTCDAHGNGYMEIPGSDACVKISGMARTQYQFAKAGSADPAGALKARGQVTIEGRRETGFGTASAKITARGDFPGDPSIADAVASLGGLSVGKVGSAGNITYGGKAGNFVHGLYQTDNSGPAIGYSLGVGFGTSIGVTIEAPTGGAKLIPDIGAGITLSQGWGSIKVGGGAVSHLSEGTKYDTDHADYPDATTMAGRTAIAALDDPADLTSFGFYAGGGAEIPIPGLSSTKIGATGFFFSGALSKMSGGALGGLEVYKRIPECTMADATAGGHATVAACNTATNAGRPLLVTPKDDGTTYAVAADLTADGFKPESIQMMPIFDTAGGNYTVGQPDEPAAMMGHINEIKQNSGFSANGGLSHSFSSDISLGVNGGFFSASEGDYGVSGFMAGGSFDYSPVAGTTFSVGGEFASRSVSFGGDDGPTKTAFEADAQSFDPSWAATVQISQSF